MSARNVSRDFFRSRWAFPWINLVYLLLGWPFYNFKSSKPNRSASPFGRKRNRELLVGLLVTLSELPIKPSQWPNLVLAKAFVKIPHRSSAPLISPLNKLQELWLIAMAPAFSFSFPLAITASSAFHSSKELFTKLQGAQTNISGSYASSANISHAYQLTSPLQLLFPTKSHSINFWKLGFGSRGASRATPQVQGYWKITGIFKFLWMISGARWGETPIDKLKWYRIG